MKLKGWHGGIGLFAALLLFAISLFSVSARAAVLYKSYIIRKAGDQDILCDPYIVQKDDYVLKIFRQRGEISNADFPEFLKLFKVINPQVKNIDRVIPGQRIFIPLKKLEPETVPDQEFGVVTIPFVTNSNIDDILKDHADIHEVKPGDSVSKLLSTNFGRYGTEAYKEGLDLFKAMNPGIENVNLIHVGQTLWLPRETIRNELWYESLFDASKNVAAEAETPPDAESTEKTEATGEGAEREASISVLAEAALLMDAKLYRKGTYYFPRAGRSDLQLDLSRFPVLETTDKARVLVTSSGDGRSLPQNALPVLKNFWKDLVVADLPEGASLTTVLDTFMGSLTGGTISEKRTLSDGGIRVTVQPRWMLDQPGKGGGSLAISPVNGMSAKTPRAIIDYLKTLGVELKEVVFSDATDDTDETGRSAISFGQVPELDASLDRQALVRDLFGILGMDYQQNTTVAFGYAGIQIKAVSNALNRPDGHLVLIDFGDLQGEAISTIEKAGFEVYQLPPQGPLADLLPGLLGAAGMTYEKNPSFEAALRSGPDNTTISVPGFLARKRDARQVLLATVPVHDHLVRFFKEKEIEVVALSNVAEAPSAVD